MSRVNVFIRSVLPGWKTNINTVVLSAAPILALFGIDYNPEQVIQWISGFSDWLKSGFVLLGIAGVYFRQLGKPRW